jgi:hypothetical protein
MLKSDLRKFAGERLTNGVCLLVPQVWTATSIRSARDDRDRPCSCWLPTRLTIVGELIALLAARQPRTAEVR